MPTSSEFSPTVYLVAADAGASRGRRQWSTISYRLSIGLCYSSSAAVIRARSRYLMYMTRALVTKNTEAAVSRRARGWVSSSPSMMLRLDPWEERETLSAVSLLRSSKRTFSSAGGGDGAACGSPNRCSMSYRSLRDGERANGGLKGPC